MEDITDQILRALRETKGKGLVIDELSARLNVDDAQTLTTALKQLISEKKIMEKTDANDAKYFIKTALESEVEHGSLGDLNGCPCFHCLKISKCGIRQPESPASCRDLEDWILTSES
ncbi:MAG: hypothetical protein ACTSUO_05925 [Candidatus Thorarchaeota archaeon]